MRELQLTIEPIQPHHRSLRRCYGCGNYERPFVEMDGVIRCEKCAKKSENDEDRKKEDLDTIDGYGLIV
jgi:hypothetical protein